MKGKIALALIVGTLLIAAPNSFAAPALDGKWSTNCFSSSLFLKSAEFTSFTGTHETLQRVFYKDDCQTLGSILTITGTISTGPLKNSNLLGIDLKVDAATLVSNDSAFVMLLNLGGVCGLHGWKVGEARNVAGLNCNDQTVPKVGEVVYDIFRVKGDSLWFGDTSGGRDSTSEATRPINLNEQKTFIRR